MRCWQQASLLNKTLKIAKMMLKSGVKSSLILRIRQTEQSNLKMETMRYTEWLQNRYCSTNKCLLNKPHWCSIVEKNLFCTLYGALKLVKIHSYMNWNADNLYKTLNFWPLWHKIGTTFPEVMRKWRKTRENNKNPWVYHYRLKLLLSTLSELLMTPTS